MRKMKANVHMRLSVAEQKALKEEINRQLASNMVRLEAEINALVLWGLHEQLGFGAVRLKKFFDYFSVSLRELSRHYEMSDVEQSWLCKRKLKEIGVDVEQWTNESRNYLQWEAK